MAFTWTMRLTKTGLLLGGIYRAVAFADPARGAITATERPRTVVEAAMAGRIDKPLELSLLEVAAIGLSCVKASGEPEPVRGAVLHATDRGEIRGAGAPGLGNAT